VAILTFHSVDRAFHPGFNNYHPKRLKNLLIILKDAGYQFVSLSDYLKSTPDERLISITFDDGFESFNNYVQPILIELEVPSTVFIPFGFIGKKAIWDYMGVIGGSRHLTCEQIKKLSDFGVEFASHGYSHINLTGLSERILRLELERSKKGLEDLAGKEVKFISYPFGRFNGLVESLAAEAGYEQGFSLSFFKKSRYGFTIPRYAVYSTDTLYSVDKKLSGGICNRLENIKGAIMNSYSYGTIFLNKLRASSQPKYH